MSWAIELFSSNEIIANTLKQKVNEENTEITAIFKNYLDKNIDQKEL